MTKIKTYIKLILIISASSLLFVSACKPMSSDISDLNTLNQRHAFYLSKYPKNKRLVDPTILRSYTKKYQKEFTKPWTLKTKNLQNSDSLKKIISKFKRSPGYGENKQKHKSEWISSLEKDMSIKTYPNFIQKAITVQSTNIRVLPTFKPILPHFKHNGGGFPFDRAQNSAIAAGTPIMITQVNKKKTWVYAITPFAQGWIDIRDIAYVGPKFLKTYLSLRKSVAITAEEVELYNYSNQYLFSANIGTLFKLLKTTKRYYIVAVPVASTKRYAFFKHIKIDRNKAHIQPMPLTYKNLSKVADELAGKPYGWGGLYGNRDCSAMIKDLFTPFGIWLPRHSSSQAKHTGTFVDLKNLDGKVKESIILNSAIPYLTLIWYPGHIMLYVGEHKGDPIIFHNIWGIRTKDKLKRRVIGKSVITTLNPGKSLSKANHKKSILNKIQGMTYLLPGYVNYE
jgi:cell wall-associated NlpC family hydrolase